MTTEEHIEELRFIITNAVARIDDMLEGDDGEAFSQARDFADRYRPRELKVLAICRSASELAPYTSRPFRVKVVDHKASDASTRVMEAVNKFVMIDHSGEICDGIYVEDIFDRNVIPHIRDEIWAEAIPLETK